MLKTLGFLVTCLAAISLVVLSPLGPILMLALSLTGIGIPVVVVLMAVPVIFLFLAIVFFISLLQGGRGWLSYLSGGLVGVVALTAIPYVANRNLEQHVRQFVSSDRDEVISGRIRRLAIIEEKAAYGADSACGGLCQRILLNGNVDELIVAAADLRQAFDPDLRGTLHRRYKSDKCPAVTFKPGGSDFRPKDERHARGDKRPDELLLLQIVNGNCVQRSTAQVASADAVLMRQQKRWGDPARPAGWDIWAQDAKTDSLSLLQRKDGMLSVTYRKTIVHYSPLLPVLAPTVTGIAFNGFGRNQTGFYRQSASLNAESKYSVAPDMGSFLADRLKFDLALHDDQATQQIRDLARSALHSDLEASMPAIEIFFAGIGRDRDPNAADLDLAARLLGDGKVELPLETRATMRHIISKRPEHAGALAKSLFARFAALTGKAKSSLTKEEGYQIYRCAEAIAQLPENAVQSYFLVFQRVAREEWLRHAASPMLRHVSSFDERGVSLALYLLEDSWRFRKPDEAVNSDWQLPYLAGLTAICRMGAKAKSATPELEAMLAQNHIAEFASYKRLWEQTRQSLGGAEPKGPFACSY